MIIFHYCYSDDDLFFFVHVQCVDDHKLFEKKIYSF